MVDRLNDVAHNISFGSQRGNLLLAIRNNIHVIDHKQYIPHHLSRDVIGIKFIECEQVPQAPCNLERPHVQSAGYNIEDGNSRLEFVVEVSFIFFNGALSEIQQLKKQCSITSSLLHKGYYISRSSTLVT